MSQSPVVVVAPQDRVTRFVGKNWKSAAGALLMVGAALAQGQHWITPELAAEITKAGAGLLGFGVAHKLERLIALYQAIQAQQVVNALQAPAPQGDLTGPPPSLLPQGSGAKKPGA